MGKHQEYRGRERARVVIDNPLVPQYSCPACGKVAYLSRRDAKVSAKQKHQGNRVRVYPCRYASAEYWHITTMGAYATAAYKDYADSLWRERQGVT